MVLLSKGLSTKTSRTSNKRFEMLDVLIGPTCQRIKTGERSDEWTSLKMLNRVIALSPPIWEGFSRKTVTVKTTGSSPRRTDQPGERQNKALAFPFRRLTW